MSVFRVISIFSHKLEFIIRREHILEDTLNNFEAIPEKEINHELKFNIEYQNEVGQDLGIIS